MTALAGALAMMGCASVAPERAAAPFVVPSQTVRHGMDADAYYRTGRYFQGQARLDQAMEAYRSALAIQAGHVDALNALGVIHSLQRKPELAEQYFRSALDADPLAARVHNNLGYHLLQNGRAGEALVAFERARELEPGNADTQANLAAARTKMGLSGEAAVASLPIPTAVPEPVPAPVQVADPVADPARSNTVPVGLDQVSEGIWELGRGKGDPGTQAVPAAAAVAAAAPVPAAAVAATGRVEIANGNGASGLARRVSGLLAPQGAKPPRLTNDKPYGVQTSRIQYVAGSERMAQELNARLPSPLPLALAETLERDVRVRVLLGKDFPQSSLAGRFSNWRNS